ncbi:hypothetical protein HK101_005685 [Irineochytrium annulatum]|nr:hypothetical protein HK101_005685 [Irineochytrium annulatum]
MEPAETEPDGQVIAPVATVTAPMDPAHYTTRILEILRHSDIEQVTAKRVRKTLESELGVDFTPIKHDLDLEIRKRYEQVVAELEPEAESAPRVSGPVEPAPPARAAAAVKSEHSNGTHAAHAADVGDAGAGHTAAPVYGAPRRTGPKIKSEEVVHDDDDDDEDPGVESDGAMARRLQGEELAPRTRGGGAVAAPKRARKPAKPRDPDAPKKGGFHVPNVLSPALAELTGEEQMSRPAVVKFLWAYIKEHDLQNPSKKTQILNDEPLKKVFGKQKMGAFEMNKLLTAHLTRVGPYGQPMAKKRKRKEAEEVSEENDEDEDEDEDEDDDGDGDGDDDGDYQKPKRAKTTRASRAATRSAKKPRGGGGSKSNTGFNKPMILSPELAAFMGTDRLSRPGCVKKLWAYIKEHDLQNPAKKTEIINDDAMKKVFGQDVMGSFEMNKLLTRHLSKDTGDVAVKEELVEDEEEGDEDSGDDAMEEDHPVKREGADHADVKAEMNE